MPSTIQSLFWLSLSFATSFALPTTGHVVHEKRGFALNYDRIRLDSDAIIPIRIALRQSNLHNGYDQLMDVSHPSSPNYGKHLSADEVHEMFAPSQDSVDAVKAWLVSSGLEDGDVLHYENKGWLALDIPASYAENLFKTNYFEYEKSGKHMIGCDEYSLPAHLSEHIDFIKPGVKLSAPLKKRTVKRDSTSWSGRHDWPGPPHFPAHHWPHWQPPPAAGNLPPALRDCGANITPTCIKALYSIPDAHFKQPVNVMGLFETYDAFSQGDINLFFKNFAPNVPQGTTPQVDSVDGGTAPVAPGSVRNSGESDIDLDLAYSLIYPQTVCLHYRMWKISI